MYIVHQMNLNFSKQAVKINDDSSAIHHIRMQRLTNAYK